MHAVKRIDVSLINTTGVTPERARLALALRLERSRAKVYLWLAFDLLTLGAAIVLAYLHLGLGSDISYGPLQGTLSVGGALVALNALVSMCLTASAARALLRSRLLVAKGLAGGSGELTELARTHLKLNRAGVNLTFLLATVSGGLALLVPAAVFWVAAALLFLGQRSFRLLRAHSLADALLREAATQEWWSEFSAELTRDREAVEKLILELELELDASASASRS